MFNTTQKFAFIEEYLLRKIYWWEAELSIIKSENGTENGSWIFKNHDSFDNQIVDSLVHL